MKTSTRIAGVTLAAAALGMLGAGVASAATTAPGQAGHAGHVSATQGGDSFAAFTTINGANNGDAVQIASYDQGTFDSAPAAGTVLHYGDSTEIDLSTTNDDLAEGKVTFNVLAPNGNTVGSFTEKLLFTDNGTPLGQRTVVLSNNSVPTFMNTITANNNDVTVTNGSY